MDLATTCTRDATKEGEAVWFLYILEPESDIQKPAVLDNKALGARMPPPEGLYSLQKAVNSA